MLHNLNNSTLFAGLLTLILNMGGRNTSFALNKKQQQLFLSTLDEIYPNFCCIFYFYS